MVEQIETQDTQEEVPEIDKEEIVFCICLDSATSTCLVVAPIFKLLPDSLMPESSLILLMSIISE